MEKNHFGFTLNLINAYAFGKLKIFSVPKKNILNFFSLRDYCKHRLTIYFPIKNLCGHFKKWNKRQHKFDYFRCLL